MDKEYLEVLDKNGNPTGKMLERNEVHEKNLLHNEVSIFIVNNKGELLLQKRSKTKVQMPGKWAPTAGHVNAHESLIETVIRETKEEIDLDITEKDIHFIDREIRILEKNSRVTNYYYVICNKNIKDFKIQKEELDEIKWFKIDDIIHMIKTDDITTIFNNNHLQYMEYLKKYIIHC